MFWVSNLVYGKTEKIWNVFACIKWHILGLLSQCSVKLPCLFYYLFMISLDLWNVENYIFDFIFVYMIKVWLYSGVLVIGIILPDLLQPSNAMWAGISDFHCLNYTNKLTLLSTMKANYLPKPLTSCKKQQQWRKTH